MTHNVGLCLALTASLLVAGAASAQKPGSQQPKTFKKRITKTVQASYLLYLPKEYGKDSEARWPLVLFLHGAGERGDDLKKVEVHGPPKLVAQGKQFPFILVSPQCPENGWWDPEVLNALLDSLTTKYKVDQDRIYVTGLSMGGYGTWALASAYPNRFAAIVPICGGGDPRSARRLAKVPVWAFHGGKDPVVPLKENQDMVDAVKAAGGDAKITIYPDAEHDSWTETYNNPAVYDWLLEHKRAK